MIRIPQPDGFVAAAGKETTPGGPVFYSLLFVRPVPGAGREGVPGAQPPHEPPQPSSPQSIPAQEGVQNPPVTEIDSEAVMYCSARSFETTRADACASSVG